MSVLDGGLKAWTSVGGELHSGMCPSAYEDSGRGHNSLPVRSIRDGAFVDKIWALSALQEPDVTVVDSLSPESFDGSKKSRYGRRGHITSAINVPYISVVDKNSGRFFDNDVILNAFEKAGVELNGRAGSILVY